MSIIKILDTARYLRYFGVKLPRILKLTTLGLSDDKLIEVGNTFTITANILPLASIENANLQWSVSGPISIENLSEYNLTATIKCNGVGNYSITATTGNELVATVSGEVIPVQITDLYFYLDDDNHIQLTGTEDYHMSFSYKPNVSNTDKIKYYISKNNGAYINISSLQNIDNFNSIFIENNKGANDDYYYELYAINCIDTNFDNTGINQYTIKAETYNRILKQTITSEAHITVDYNKIIGFTLDTNTVKGDINSEFYVTVTPHKQYEHLGTLDSWYWEEGYNTDVCAVSDVGNNVIKIKLLGTGTTTIEIFTMDYTASATINVTVNAANDYSFVIGAEGNYNEWMDLQITVNDRTTYVPELVWAPGLSYAELCDYCNSTYIIKYSYKYWDESENSWVQATPSPITITPDDLGTPDKNNKNYHYSVYLY